MKVFKKVKAAGAAGLAALMLTIGAAGITADAAELPNPDTCPHIFTADEYVDTRAVGTEVHSHGGLQCTITYMQDFYDIRCRVCGATVRENVGRGIKEIHSRKD